MNSGFINETVKDSKRSFIKGKKSRVSNSVVGNHASFVSGTFKPGGMSSSKMKAAYINSMKGVQVFDDNGNDVTPLPLFSPNKSHRNVGGSSGAGSQSSNEVKHDSVADVLTNLESLAYNRSTWSTASKEMLGFSTNSRMSMSGASEDDSSSMAESDAESEALNYHNNEVSNWSRAVKAPTEIDMSRMINLTLMETESICLFDIPSICVSNENVDELAIVKASNARYKDLKSKQANNDNLVEKSMQTFNFATKNKDIQATALKYADKESMVNQWEIYDTYAAELAREAIETNEANAATDEALLGLEGVNSVPGLTSADMISAADSSSLSMPRSSGTMQFSGSTIEQSYTTDPSMQVMQQSMSMQPSMSLSVADSSRSSVATQFTATNVIPASSTNTIEDRERSFNALNQESLKSTLFIMERAVLGNIYIGKLLEYRDVSNSAGVGSGISAEEQMRLNLENEILNGRNDGNDHQPQENPVGGRIASHIPSMHFLWSFRCELTRGRSVTCMSWNKNNQDILSIAYGECRIVSPVVQSQGLVLCWSVKNPEWPERIYRTQSPVTALDFSKSSPNLLTIGHMDGRITIVDVRKNDFSPILDNRGNAGKHREAIWELKWIEKEKVQGDEETRAEIVVSVSTDGRITEWIIHKGLEYTDLMTLKRVTKQSDSKSSTARGGAFISRLAGGLCFDFNPKDSNIYVVGTDDGNIHRCSCTLYEQYLSTYFGHTSPVYRIKWSPFLSGTFLSCSADWTVRLWNQDSEDAVFKFQSGKDSISDIAWSPTCSTVFGAVSVDGRMEIWDLEFSVLDPAILHTVLDRQLTCIEFAPKSPVVLVGDDNGAVNFYKLEQTSINSFVKYTAEEQAQRLSDVLDSKKQNSSGIPVPNNTNQHNTATTA